MAIMVLDKRTKPLIPCSEKRVRPLLAGGGRTNWKRTRLEIPKSHCRDAVGVGRVDAVKDGNRPGVIVKTMGCEACQRTRLTPYGLPRGYLTRPKRVQGCQTAARVNTIVTTPNTAKSSVGHVAVRASGHFNGQTAQNLAQGISRRYCKLISRADGEGYSITQVALQKGGAGMERAHPAALSLPGMNAGVSRAT